MLFRSNGHWNSSFSGVAIEDRFISFSLSFLYYVGILGFSFLILSIADSFSVPCLFLSFVWVRGD